VETAISGAGFWIHGPAVSGKNGFFDHLDDYDPYTSMVVLKSTIHPQMASAEFKYLFSGPFLPAIRILNPWPE
jgi:hypothetical protein